MFKRIKKEYAILFIILLALCFLFPYTGDDWAWGSSIGIERLMTWFDNYSGRYFGNLIVLALTRSNILKTVIMATCISGIVILLDQLTKEKKGGFYFILVMILLVPTVVLRQAIVWTAGFANYTTSIFLTLLYIYYVRDIYNDECPKFTNKAVLPLLILGICNTLIVEHLTIYNVVLAIYVLVYVFVKFKKVFMSHVFYLMGTCMGTIYMFSNTVYRSVSEGTDGYRTIGSERGIIYKAIETFVKTICQEGFLNNAFLNVCIFIVCFLVYRNIKTKLSKTSNKLSIISMTIIGLFAVYSVINFQGEFIAFRGLNYLEAALTILYIVSIIVFVLVLPIAFQDKAKLAFIFGSAGCIMGPLLVVSPVGSRCFFASYVMLIYLVMELYKHVSTKDKDAICNKIIWIKLLICVVFVFYFYIFGTINKADKIRIEKARNDIASGAETIEVKNLPYTRFLWCANPEKDTVWEERFILFYGLGENVQIENIKVK